MSDMLVRLYDLPALPPSGVVGDSGIRIRRAMAYELVPVTRWVSATFGPGWEGECAVCFARQPISCFIAVKDERVVGFACYETTCRGFFGPTGVDEAQRGQGIGTRLLLECLHDMRNIGYGYAVIGGAGPVDFYVKTVGAVPIEGSKPGIYPDGLRSQDTTAT
jgi:GNAT superfamily N-acetyltransferase